MSQSTREKLINSAIKVFSNKGYFNTKISDIVKDAGLAQGTFYIYFKSKKDIFAEIVNFVVYEIEDTIRKFEEKEGNSTQIIKEFAREILEILYKFKDIAYIFFFQAICMEEEFRKINIETSQKIKEFYQKKIKDELKAEILIGYGKRVVEFDLLIEKRDKDYVINKFLSAVDLIVGEEK
ncbi:transcriptional regulator, TetR family [Persephonella hydrogeniphila]|uniref:Transcriptional regulator, TetR family n=1 Tax=Persephonella hydrogeniphila TaxID=198703 RepID=A0A285N2A6_9AQUI|nr:TetR/AcrR family transcriptional regulator [Persephonella hydrogeniphila]SNZ02927.1 transcriptional regulator, TetR family [Persephonella hydrogeniphila]